MPIKLDNQAVESWLQRREEKRREEKSRDSDKTVVAFIIPTDGQNRCLSMPHICFDLTRAVMLYPVLQ